MGSPGNNYGTTNGLKESFSTFFPNFSFLNYLRFAMLISFLLMQIAGVFSDNETIKFQLLMEFRLGISAFCFIIFLLSYIVKEKTDLLLVGLYTAYALLIVWLFISLFLTENIFHFAFAWLIIFILVMSAIKQKQRQDIFYTIFSLLSLLAIFLSDYLLLEKFLFSALAQILFTVTYLFVRLKGITYKNIQYHQLVHETIFNESRAGILLIDYTTGKLRDCNQSAVSLFKAHSKQDLLDHPKIVGDIVQRVKVTDEDHHTEQTWEYHFSTLNQLEFWGELSAQIIYPDHQPLIVVHIRDISSTKKTEKAVERLSDQKRKLLDISNSLLSTLSFEDIFTKIAETLSETIPYDMIALFWKDLSEKHLVSIASDFTSDQLKPLNAFSIPIGTGIIGDVAKTGIPQLINHAENDQRAIYPDHFKPTIEHMICIPVKIKNEVLGVFVVTRLSESKFTLEEYESVQLFISSSISAIQNGILYEEANKKALHNQSLMEVTKAISTTVSLEKVMNLVVEKVLDLTTSGHGGLFLFDKDQIHLRLVASKGLSAEYKDQLVFKKGESVAGWVAQTGEGVLIHNVEDDPHYNKLTILRDIKSMISIPLKSKGKVIGVLGADRLVNDPIFTEDEFKIAQDFADVAVLAIENAQLFEKVIESEIKYRTLFEESEDVVFVSTPEGRFIDINPAGVELFGYPSKEELLSVNIMAEIFLKSSDRQAYIQQMEEKGFVKNYEIQVKTRDGRRITVLETSKSVKSEQGKTLYYRGIMKDVSESRKLQQQLFQSQKMESIGLLAGGIAHDFNNILAGILGYASFLKNQLPIEHPFFRYSDAIEKSAKRAADLTHQLLAFARGSENQPIFLQINDTIRETLTIIGRTFDKSIKLELELDEKLPRIKADPIQLQQVILNLCVNARDAIQHKDGVIHISTAVIKLSEEDVYLSPTQIPGYYVVLEVTDNGHGMDKDTQKRIFEPFFSTKDVGKGTGLGLAMVYGVIKNHEGYIHVYSELNKGTSFKVYLPIQDETEIIPSIKTIAIDPNELENLMKQHHGKTIFVIDDEQSIRNFLSEILQHYGFKIIEAVDGQEAVEVFKKRHQEIDLVILDMVMPKLNGLDAFKQMRQIDPNVTTILSSGFSQNMQLKEFLQHGIKRYLQKPYRVNDLIKIIHTVLNEQ